MNCIRLSWYDYGRQKWCVVVSLDDDDVFVSEHSSLPTRWAVWFCSAGNEKKIGCVCAWGSAISMNRTRTAKTWFYENRNTVGRIKMHIDCKGEMGKGKFDGNRKGKGAEMINFPQFLCVRCKPSNLQEERKREQLKMHVPRFFCVIGTFR